LDAYSRVIIRRLLEVDSRRIIALWEPPRDLHLPKSGWLISHPISTPDFGTVVTAQKIAHPDKGHVTVPNRSQGGTRRRRTRARACGGACRGPQDRVFRQTCSTVAKPVVEPAPQNIVPKPTEPNPDLENEEEE
jgi:hypothetical protein